MEIEIQQVIVPIGSTIGFVIGQQAPRNLPKWPSPLGRLDP
jgi:hypothetical protein